MPAPFLHHGEEFHDGEIVNAARLHKLVDDATILPGAIGSAELADGAVTSAKLATTIDVQLGNLILSDDNIAIGDSANRASALPVETVQFELTPKFRIKDKGVTNALIADEAVTPRTVAKITPDPTGSYGDATHVAKLTVDSVGRVTSASQVAIDAAAIAPVKSVAWSFDMLASAAGKTLTTEAFSDTAILEADGYLECIAADVPAGHVVGDHIPLWATVADGPSPADGPAFTLVWSRVKVAEVTTTTLVVRRVALGGGGVISALNKNTGFLTTLSMAKYKLGVFLTALNSATP